MIIVAFLIGYIGDVTGPQKYHYNDEIVVVYDKYQCPTHCAINHAHYVHYDKNITKNDKMYINKCDLGDKIKKNRRKK
tara:strand:- start:24 stop:257 length:234 start_codon:yes stop_codon:yes gene_type:complete